MFAVTRSLVIKPQEVSSLQDLINRFLCADVLEGLGLIPSNVVDLVVTSPPYYNAKEYASWPSYEAYLEDLYLVLEECYRVLKPGGRLALNLLAGYGRSPWIPVAADVTCQLRDIGFLLRGEAIWDKGQQNVGRTAWGSWMSASNPQLRERHEVILFASKERWDKGYQGQSDITRDEFLLYTQSVWRFSAETNNPHPAPFPLELPRRCIKLLSYQGDLVLDPFMGSGTTALAAALLKRRFIGIDRVEEYCWMAARRLEQALGPVGVALILQRKEVSNGQAARLPCSQGA